jgi:hypothetical protein
MSLSLGSQPGFTEISDATFDAGNAASDAALKALNTAAKFAAVRNEQFFGYYGNGETVALPTSPADGYAYARSELRYSFGWYWTGSATGACNGTQTAPSRGATTGAGQLLQMGANVDQATGVVSTVVSYFKSAEQDTTDGILLVITHAQRSR